MKVKTEENANKEKASACEADATSKKTELKLHNQIISIKTKELASGLVCENCLRSGDEAYELQALRTGSNPPVILRPSCKIVNFSETVSVFEITRRILDASIHFNLSLRETQFLGYFLDSLESEASQVFLLNVRFSKFDFWLAKLKTSKPVLSKIIKKLESVQILRTYKRDSYRLQLVLTEEFCAWFTGLSSLDKEARPHHSMRTKRKSVAGELISESTHRASVIETELVDNVDNSEGELISRSTVSLSPDQLGVDLQINGELISESTRSLIEDPSPSIPLQLALPDSSPPMAKSVDNFDAKIDAAQIKDDAMADVILGHQETSSLPHCLDKAGALKIVKVLNEYPGTSKEEVLDFLSLMNTLPIPQNARRFDMNLVLQQFRRRHLELEEQSA